MPRQRFAPVSLEVDNPSAEPFDGTLRLSRTQLGGGRLGAVLVQPAYLAPRASRRVQFYPQVLSDYEDWTLEWDGGSTVLPKPRLGPPATALLVAENELFDRGGAVKRFPERLFPPFVTATDGLAELFLDHVPDWQAQQRQAFLDWLRRGGTVHLIAGPDGKLPRFSGELVDLNEPSDAFRVGAGLVRRHAVRRVGLTADFLKRLAPPPPLPEEVEAARTDPEAWRWGQFKLEDWKINGGLFTRLRQMVSTAHQWGVIHLMSLAYVAVIFPGCFLVGREFRDARLTFGLIAAATVVFTGAFWLTGRRGYGESTSVHSIALAEHLGGSRFDVSQWTSVFVTAGGDYALSCPGTGNLYSDATDAEAVNGEITFGADGRFAVDVPPYSTRQLADRAVVEAPDAPVPTSVPATAPGEILPSFRRGPGWAAGFERAVVLIENKAVGYARRGDLLVPGASQPTREFLRIADDDFYADNGGLWQDESNAQASTFEPLVRPLILHRLRLSKQEELNGYRVPAGRARLFVVGDLGRPFQTLSGELDDTTQPIAGEPLPNQTGRVVYSFEVPL